MKQVLQSYRSGELWLAEVPAPATRRGGVVVRTGASLVSAGTERMIIELAKKSLVGKAMARPDLVKQVIKKIQAEGLGPTLTKVFAKLDTPIALGYSAAGRVVEAGAGASGLSVGDRVACAGAGYATHAEYNFVPRNLCAKIPDGVSDEDAAFATLGAIAMQGVRQADPRLGERVAVIGLGLLGLLTVQLLKAAGCAVIGSDPDAERCALARELGADEAVAGGLEAAAAAFSDGRGVDAAIITAATPSNAPIETAAEITRAKGRVVVVGLVGMDIPRDPFYRKELDLRLSMSYGPGRYDPEYEEGGRDYPFAYVRFTEQRNMESFLYLVSTGAVRPSALVTHRYAIDDALDAYALLEGKGPEGPEKHLGIVINYPAREGEGEVGAGRPTRRVEIAGGKAMASGSIGIGFIGAGGFARSVLLPAVKRRDDLTPVGVCTATGMSGVETAKKHGFAFATTDIDELLGDDRVRAVFIATRHNTHAPFAARALRAGKHVFLEKPLAIDEESLAALLETVDELGAECPTLAVGFNRRFSPHARAIVEAVRGRSGPAQVLYRVNAGRVPRDSWIQDPEVGGGRIVGEGCHFVDFCAAVTGSPVRRVFAESVSAGDATAVAEDSVSISMRHEDGSLSTIVYTAEGSGDLAKEFAEVHAGGRSAVMDNFTTTRMHGGGSGVKGSQAKGFAEEIEAFVRAVRTGEQAIPLASLVNTTRATFAAVESLRTGRAVEVG